MKNIRFVSMALLTAFLMLVHRTTSAQVVTTLAGSGGPGSVDGNGAEASFSYPLGLSVGPSGNVYVADTNSLKIRKVTPEGLVTTLAGDGRPGYDDGIRPQARFFGPLGVAADVFGNVWVADQEGFIKGLACSVPFGHTLRFSSPPLSSQVTATTGSHHGMWELR